MLPVGEHAGLGADRRHRDPHRSRPAAGSGDACSSPRARARSGAPARRPLSGRADRRRWARQQRVASGADVSDRATCCWCRSCALGGRVGAGGYRRPDRRRPWRAGTQAYRACRAQRRRPRRANRDNLEGRSKATLADFPQLALLDAPIRRRQSDSRTRPGEGLSVDELMPVDAKASAELATLMGEGVSNCTYSYDKRRIALWQCVKRIAGEEARPRRERFIAGAPDAKRQRWQKGTKTQITFTVAPEVVDQLRCSRQPAPRQPFSADDHVAGRAVGAGGRLMARQIMNLDKLEAEAADAAMEAATIPKPPPPRPPKPPPPPPPPRSQQPSRIQPGGEGDVK